MATAVVLIAPPGLWYDKFFWHSGWRLPRGVAARSERE
jgi:hypothetical protein